MKQYYYYKAFRKTIVQFLDLFNDIQVARYNNKGVFQKYIKVPLKYAPKEKIWYWLNERHDDEMLPQLGVTLQGVEFDPERLTNRQKYIVNTTSASAGTIQRYLNPTPYNFQFQVGVWALYMYDIDQILEQILPFFNPYAYTRIKIPELYSTYENKVIFNSVSPDFEFEYSDDTMRILKYTLDFTVQSYLFKPIEDAGLAKKIYINFFLNENTFSDRSLTSTFNKGASGETMALSGVEPWDVNNPMMDYEIWQYGTKIGKTLRVDP